MSFVDKSLATRLKSPNVASYVTLSGSFAGGKVLAGFRSSGGGCKSSGGKR